MKQARNQARNQATTEGTHNGDQHRSRRYKKRRFEELYADEGQPEPHMPYKRVRHNDTKNNNYNYNQYPQQRRPNKPFHHQSNNHNHNHNNQHPEQSHTRNFQSGYSQKLPNNRNLNAKQSIKYTNTSNYKPPNNNYSKKQINSTNTSYPLRNTKKYTSNTQISKPKEIELETDLHRITQRMRQIDIGKNTDGYKNYIISVPKKQRKHGHPRTPNARKKTKNKHWKKAMNDWRKALHKFDDLQISNSQNDEKEGNLQSIGDVKENNNNKPKELVVETLLCEKCKKQFNDCELWQTHRNECNGNKENVTPKAEIKKISPKKQKIVTDLESDIIPDFPISDSDSDFQNSTDNEQDNDEENTETNALLSSLQNVLDDDDDDDDDYANW